MSDIKSDSYRMQLFDKMCDKFSEFGVDVCREKLIRLLGQIAVNGYECKRYDIASVTLYSHKFLGFGLYIPISMYNHSCTPNAAYINFGNKIQLRALRPIAANEEIFIDYIPIDRPSNERQLIFRNDWFFKCNCDKCDADNEDINYNLIKCLSSKSDSQHSVTERQLKVLKQIYTKFHPAYSFYLLAHLAVRVESYCKNAFNSNDENLRELIIDTYWNVKLTHGLDHELFKAFGGLVRRKINMSIQ